MAESQALAAITPQVSLDAASSWLVRLGTDVLNACHSDNVHPHAVGACYMFGSSLPAMCTTTTTKITKLATRNGDHRKETFAATICYQPLNVASQLANDEGGRESIIQPLARH